MRPALVWLLGALAIAAGVHAIALHTTPRAIMRVAMDRMAEPAGRNAVVHAPEVTAESRAVVRPSPDLAYSICVFDLSDGPVDVTLPRADVYISLSLYAPNTDNFFRLSDRDMTGDLTTVRIVTDAADAVSGDGGFDVVALSPAAKGVALVRRLVPSPDAWPEVEADRALISCAPAA